MIKNKKFLPIGTICTIQGNNDKLMITGYFSTEFNDQVKMFDYSACAYPEGILLKRGICSFNHEDIIDVEFEGYVNETFDKFNAKMMGQNTTEQISDTNGIFKNIKFDENGVVIFASTTDNVEKEESIKFLKNDIPDVKNPFIREEIKDNTESVKSDENVNEWPIFSNLKFDENGIIIEE